MTGSPAFWNRNADRYAARRVSDPEAYAATLARTRAHLSASHCVLEVGCGTGATAVELAPCVATYTATDYAPRMIEIARARPEAAEAANLTFRVAGMSDDTGAPWDAVLAFNLLQLADDLPATLATLHSLVRPGGLFISKSVCVRDLSLPVRALLPGLRLMGWAPRLTAFSAAELEAAMRAAGFDIVETGDYPAARAARFIVARRA